jgi:hypothetical protein
MHILANESGQGASVETVLPSISAPALSSRTTRSADSLGMYPLHALHPTSVGIPNVSKIVVFYAERDSV